MTAKNPEADSEKADSERGAGLPLLAVFTLASLSALGPLAIDMYLAAFPTISSDFSTSEVATQFTLTAFMLGMGTGQFLIGPLSDKLGRRRPLLFGMAFCALSALACFLAPSIELFIAARFLMGFTGSIGMVISRAIVADSTQGAQTARLMSLLMMINGFAPVLAPLLGGLILSYGHWRTIFAFIALFVLCSLALVIFTIKESLPPEARRQGSLLGSYRGMVEALQVGSYRGYMLTLVFGFGALFAYISGSPYLLQKVLGLSEIHFTYAFGINSLGIVLASSINRRLVGKVDPRKVLKAGSALMLAATGGLLLHLLTGPLLPVTLLLLFSFTTSCGLIFGNASALALGQVKRVAGAASALMGTFQALAGVLASPLVALGGSSNPLPMALTMLAAACLSALALASTGRAQEPRSS